MNTKDNANIDKINVGEYVNIDYSNYNNPPRYDPDPLKVVGIGGGWYMVRGMTSFYHPQINKFIMLPGEHRERRGSLVRYDSDKYILGCIRNQVETHSYTAMDMLKPIKEGLDILRELSDDHKGIGEELINEITSVIDEAVDKLRKIREQVK